MSRYGPHESKEISKPCRHLENNGLIDDDNGPWGAIIVLAAKPNQEDIPWHEHIWRICVSYRRLNQVARQFAFPIRRCSNPVVYGVCLSYCSRRAGRWAAAAGTTVVDGNNRMLKCGFLFIE
jgi:hypothetical protein